MAFCCLCVVVLPDPSITSPINQTYSLGDNATLTCNSTEGPDGNTYQWQMNDIDIENETSQTLVLIDLSSEDGGKYTCVVSNTAGNDTASTYVFIAPYFTTQPMSISRQIGSSGNLSCVAKAFPNPEYEWVRVDEEPIREGIVTNESTLLISSIMIGDEGIYFCNVTSGETSFTSQYATVYGKVVTKFVHTFKIIQKSC